jgi:hypothetical protein
MGPVFPDSIRSTAPDNYWFRRFGRTYAATAKLASFRIMRLDEKQEEREFGKSLE